MVQFHNKNDQIHNKIQEFALASTKWIGSASSLIYHTLLFVAFGLIMLLQIFPFASVMLVLTTLVSLEAIYLSIFIQMTVNMHAEQLSEIAEDIDEIQDEVGELQEDVGELSNELPEAAD
jgi:uncharacterized membrane protein (DUF106 family)